ncbi:MAG: ParB/RepB/Spo0J family partition protein [Candidatus Krumholzibacteriia bacterium]
MAKNRVLGKGLSALIQGAEAPALTNASGGREVREVPLDELAFNPDQPRKVFKQDKLEELAASLRDVGVLQPVLVRALGRGEALPPVRDGGPTPRFIVVAGERRVRAARLAGLDTVPAIACSYEETEALRIALLENIQRENLGPIEEAQAYQGLIDAYGATQEEFADMLGKNRSTVANALRLLSLEEEIRELVESGVLSRGHAKALLSVPAGEPRLRLARLCRSRGLSVREVERRAQGAAAARQRARRQRLTDGAAGNESREVRALRERAEAHFGSPVTIDRDSAGKGKVSVAFFDDADLERLLAMMGVDTRID